MDIEEIAQKRSILLSTKTRFTPELQPVREAAIDKIVEQNLLLMDSPNGISIQQMEEQGAFCFIGGYPSISHRDVNNSLTRLNSAGRVNILGKKGKENYRLSEVALQEQSEIQRIAEGLFTRVLGKLFKNAPEGTKSYNDPFLDCLCRVFSRLSAIYVRILKKEIDTEELLSMPSLLQVLTEIRAIYPKIDHQLFESAVFNFFRDSDPDYDAIKWNMAQNYYISQVLGLDPSGRLFSTEVFGHALFYLDTNVVIPALESRAQHHGNFKIVSEACNQLGIELKVCQITIDELRGVIADQRNLITKVADQIPDSISPKVRGIFYELFRDQLKSAGKADLDTIFVNFKNPTNDLREDYQVELIDDVWFTEATESDDTKKLTEELIRVYRDKRGRPKGRGSAIHDALLLQWIWKEREATSENTWLVTLDTTLPRVMPKNDGTTISYLAITLDALIQWISPVVIYRDSNEIAAIFSEAVKYQLLPQDSFFDLRDFLMFAEMEWDCKSLPVEDVEESIRFIKKNAPNLDPNNPVDREKLAREMTKFFADPGRKYNREMQRMEAEIASMEERHRLEGLDRDKQDLERDNQVLERDNQIAELKQQQAEQERKEREDNLKKSAQIRAVLAFLFLIVIEVIAIYIAGHFGNGQNIVQRIMNLWEIPVVVFGLWVTASWFIIGRTRIQALGWPVTKILKDN